MVSYRCGVCRDCRLHRAREAAIRCYHESTLHEENCWLTLTYERDPCSVAKVDLQKFFRRLRRAGFRFRYVAVGEYGEAFSRPHYHVCMFGMDFGDRYPWKRSHGGLLYRSKTLEKYWKWGHALISELTLENAGYTCRYTLKKITGDLAEEHYQREFNGVTVNVTPEFVLWSTKPAIGRRWIEKYWREVFPADEVIYKGRPCPVPRYYFKWLEGNQPEMAARVRGARMAAYAAQERETGLRQVQSAQARDGRTRNLKRSYESSDP